MKKVYEVLVYVLTVFFLCTISVFANPKDEYINRRKDSIEGIADMGLNMNASRSYVHKPLAMLFLEKDVEEANKILCSSYIADVDFDNDTYELYWAMPALTTLYYMFGSDGPTEKTLLTSESEAVVVRKLYEFLKRETVGQIDDNINPLRVPASENHNMIMKITTYLISEKLSGQNKYKSLILPCGDTVYGYSIKAKKYLNDHLSYMIKNGVTVEGGDTYVAVSLESVYNLYAFSADRNLRAKAKTYLDLYWIKYASESIDLIKAGAKARCYSYWSQSGSGRLYALASVYFGETVYENEIPFVTPLVVSYYPPTAACEILENKDSFAPYEYIERNVGVGTHIVEVVANAEWPVYYYDNSDTIARYSYVTPDYILGSFIRDPKKSYVMITSQNQYEGAVFKNDKRIYRYIDREGVNIHNGFVTMQKGEVMISKKGAVTGNVGVYISDCTVNDMSYQNGWCFFDKCGAYIALYAANGFLWTDGKLLIEKENDIFIMRLGRKTDYSDFKAFKNQIANNKITYSDGVMDYTDSVWGSFIFSPDADSNIRLHNGNCIDGEFEYTVKSPFSEQKYGSGSFSVKLGDEYTWNLSDCTKNMTAGNENTTEAIKIYGIPSPGNELYAKNDSDGEGWYRWYIERPDGNWEYICSENVISIDESLENSNIKVKYSNAGNDLYFSDSIESVPIRIRGERDYKVTANNWAESGITEEKSEDCKTLVTNDSISLIGGNSGSVKVRKSFSPIAEPTVIEFTAKNSGGSANVGYINGNGGTAVSINVNNGTYLATVGKVGDGVTGVTLKSDTSDGQSVHFKVIIKPGKSGKAGYVTIFCDGVPKVFQRPMRVAVSDVRNLYFVKNALEGTLVIEKMSVYTLKEEKGTELFEYDGGIGVVADKEEAALLVRAYFDGDRLTDVKLNRCTLTEGINYLDQQEQKDGGRVFLLSDMETLKPLAESLIMGKR